MTEDRNKLYNLMGTYCSGKMLQNHMACIIRDQGASKKERHLYNKMRAVEREVGVLLKSTERYLKEIGAEEDVENMIFKIHELVDPIITPTQK